MKLEEIIFCYSSSLLNFIHASRKCKSCKFRNTYQINSLYHPDALNSPIPAANPSHFGQQRAAGPGFRAERREVYVMNNDGAENAILVFDRAKDGTLTETGSYATGGQGTGVGLAHRALSS